MNPKCISIGIWLSATSLVSGDPPEVPRIVIPDLVEADFSDRAIDDLSAITRERRDAVSAKIAKAFSNADSVSIASLEPNSLVLMKRFRPEMVALLRKDLIDGRAYYGSLTLADKAVPKFKKAIISSIEGIGTPRLGFCWSPRHAVIIRKAKEPDIVIEICYQCGGMRLKDSEETLTFYPPREIHRDMDALFEAHKVPRSTPIKRRAEPGGAEQPATAAEAKSKDNEQPKPESERPSR